MRRRIRPSRFRGPAGWALAVVFVVGPALATPLNEPAGGASSSRLATAAPSTSPLPFAERAGFLANRESSVIGLHPAGADLHVDVVFQLRASAPPSPTPGGDSYLTPQQFLRTFAPSADTVRAAESYFARYGLTTASVSPDRLVLSLVGPAPDFGRAFGTDLLAGSREGTPVMFPSAAPALPAYLETSVAGVAGLTSGFDPFSFSLGPALGPSAPGGRVGAVAPGVVSPGDARTDYNFSSLYNITPGGRYATDHAIAVLLWGEGYYPGDLSSFFSNYYPTPPFPVPNYTAYPVDGAPPPSVSALSSPDPKAVEELTLDIEWAESMAPGAAVLAVYTTEGPPPQFGPSVANLTDALEKAISLRNTTNLSAISMSFGVPEGSDPSLAATWAPLFTEATDLGITLVAATGDTGGDTTDAPSCSQVPAPEFPSSSPDVIAVGGTQLTASGGSFYETAWSGSGGGYSQEYSAPSWQLQGSAASPIEANGSGRGLPDVSASAADDLVYYNGQPVSAAGTSFAAPLWAGLVVDLVAAWGHPLGFFTDHLYHVGASEPGGAVGAGLVDVVGGQNCVAEAGPGWDAVTGWGSPRALLLYYDLVGSFVNLTLEVGSPTVDPGGSLTVGVQLSNRTSGAPISGTNVDISLAADVPYGPCTGRFGSASPATDASGRASVRLTVPVCYLGSHADVTAVVESPTYYGNNSSRVSVNLLGGIPQLRFLDAAPWSYATYAAILVAAVVLGAVLGRRPRRSAPAASSPTRSEPAAASDASPRDPPPSPPEAGGISPSQSSTDDGARPAGGDAPSGRAPEQPGVSEPEEATERSSPPTASPDPVERNS